MSKLDTLLAQLKTTLEKNRAEKGETAPPPPAPETKVDSKQASAALKQFLQTTVVAKPEQQGNLGDEQQKVTRRKALSTFVGSPVGLTDIGKTATGTISMEARPSSGHGGHGGHGHGAKSSPAPAPAPALAPAPAAAAPAAQAPFNFAWFKHILTIESALRMGDALFAESLLNILMELSNTVQTDPAIKARLKSQSARIKLERKQLPEAEAELVETIKSLEGTPHKRTVGAAYCYHALAQVYLQQKKADRSQQAHQLSISIAEAVLGPNDPEAKLFKAPLV